MELNNEEQFIAETQSEDRVDVSETLPCGCVYYHGGLFHTVNEKYIEVPDALNRIQELFDSDLDGLSLLFIKELDYESGHRIMAAIEETLGVKDAILLLPMLDSKNCREKHTTLSEFFVKMLERFHYDTIVETIKRTTN